MALPRTMTEAATGHATRHRPTTSPISIGAQAHASRTPVGSTALGGGWTRGDRCARKRRCRSRRSPGSSTMSG